jgi:phosphoglucosamine mutase
MGRLFGTDGVRGKANEALTAELALDVSVAAAHVLAETGEFRGDRPFAVVGRDPRASGEFLEARWWPVWPAPASTWSGSGVVPTPGVAFLTATARPTSA